MSRVPNLRVLSESSAAHPRAGRRDGQAEITGLPAWSDNGDRRIALDAARTKKGNNSELRSSLLINTREFLRAVRVSRHSLYAQALFILSAFGTKQYRVESPVGENALSSI